MEEVKKYLNKAIVDNNTVIIACSGGPDSMCLLELVLEQKEAKKIKIVCAHVNHKMRAESEEEALFVEDYCKKNNIIFEYMEITNYNDDNFHNQARLKRYDFFKNLIKKYDAKYLLTAHHGDDLTETILMRIVRGSNLKGYIGFKKETDYKTYKLLRPLITETKEKIINYNKEHDILYVTDVSNEKDKYTRNRYRHVVLPFLKSEEKDVHKKFLKFNEELTKLDEFLTNYMSNILTTIVKNDTLDISLFQSQEDFIKRKILEKMIEKVQEDDLFVIEDKHIDLMLNLINSEKANCKIELPNNFIAEKSYNNFKITKNKTLEDYCLLLEDFVSINNGNISNINNSTETSNYVIRINSKELTLPLYVRNRKDGDKIEVKNMNGSKKIKDIFIDSKIPLSQRSIYPIVVDSNNVIVWIPGIKKSKFDKEITDTYDIILKYEEDNNDK
ncbi:MAG: tRNA lysidine(34) synthetase TilS [Bacilli bacterium]|nr:tRNA lysidine(34) synthetase TilS [Bacilli bacterium]